MLEKLTDQITNTLRNLRGKGKLSEENMTEALEEVQTALLSADVHFRVAQAFIQGVKTKCVGQKVLKSVTPGQQIIKIIHEELIELLGGKESKEPVEENRPLRVMMIGLHGSGKTTTSVKFARFFARKHYKPLLVACDVYRPAAIDQLETLAGQEDFLFYCDRKRQDVSRIAVDALKWGKEQEADLLIFDTAGRLQIDRELIKEIQHLRNKIIPHEIFLVADSALGQEAVNVAKEFHEAVGLSGIIVTKLDGDARGGAALSMKSVTGVPIKFMGTGEKIGDFDRFYPERMAQRILGMGDVVSLVEKAQANVDLQEAKRLEKKEGRKEFTMNDFLTHLQQLKRMGSLKAVASMMPGMQKLNVGARDDKRLAHIEAVVLSMTKKERLNPQLLNGPRRMRIAKGAGVSVSEVNQVLKQFMQLRKMIKKLQSSKGKKMVKERLGPEGIPSPQAFRNLFGQL